MPAPSYWKGYLKLSLVTCPVSMTPATSQSKKVRFHTINSATGRRVRNRYIDSETGKPVKEGDEVKGYETSEGNFVTFSDEDLEAVALESVHTIDIETFVPADAISWIWYDTPYYLAPTDKVGEEAFAVIRQAMADEGVVGVSRLVLHGREHSVMLQPRENGIILWTLRYGDEVRDPADYFSDLEDKKADPKLMKLVKDLIDDRTKPWTPKMVKDPVQQGLLSLIASKKKNRKKPAPKKKAEAGQGGGDNVVSLMDALKKSLEKSEKGTKKRK